MLAATDTAAVSVLAPIRVAQGSISPARIA